MTQKNILVIDDDLAIRIVLKGIINYFLSSARTDDTATVFTSGNGVEGLGYVFINLPDLLFLDLTLPKYDGMEIIDYIISNKQLVQKKKMPIIILLQDHLVLKQPKGISASLHKGDREFANQLLIHVSDLLGIKSDKIHSKDILPTLVKRVGTRTINLASTSDEFFYKSEKSSNIFGKLWYRFLFIVAQLFLSLSLSLFYFLTSRKQVEENIGQHKKDLQNLRVKTMPAIAVFIAGIFAVISQLCLFSFTGLTTLQLSLFPAQAAIRTWDGGGTTTDWSDCANWSSDICPTAGDSAIFNGTAPKDSVVDSTWVSTYGPSVSTVSLNSGFTKTLSLSAPLQLTSSFTQSAGTFTASNQTLDIDGDFTQNAGTFTASSGTTYVGSNFTISGGTFNHNSGTFTFDTNNTGSLSCNSATFNLVNFNGAGNQKTISSGCTLPLGNNPTLPSQIIFVAGGGILSGTGTLNQSGGLLNLSGGGALSGFTSINIFTLMTTGGTTFDFNSYSSPVVTNVRVASGTITMTTSGYDLNGFLRIEGGTLVAPSGNLTVEGDFTITSGTFDANGGTLTFDGTSSATLSCNSATFNLVAFNHTAGTKTVNSDCSLPLGSNPSLGNGGDVTLAGTLSGSGNLTQTSGTLTLNSGAAFSGFSNLNMSSGTNFVVSGATINFPASGFGFIGGNVTLNSGTLSFEVGAATSFNGDLTITGGTFTAPSFLNLRGGLTISGSPTFNANNGTIVIDDLVPTSTLSCNNVTFNLISFSRTGTVTINSNCNLPLGDNPVLGTSGLTINLSGTLSGSGTLDYVSSGGESITLNSGGTLSGFDRALFNNLTIAGATANFGSYEVFDVAGNFAITSGSFTAPTAEMTVSKDFTVSGGSFNANGGKVTLNGTNQHIVGTTFQDFTKIVTSADTLTFPAGGTETILGTLTLKGVSGGRLSLVSSSPGTQWNIDPQGTRDIDYVNVQDSHNINATAINVSNKVAGNNGNNTNWLFETITINTPSTTSPTNDNTPTWTWTASTADSGIDHYVVDWCQNSGFTGCGANTSSPTTNSFTHSSSLAEGTWYFRVKAVSTLTNESSYSSNGQVVIDTIAPSSGGGSTSVTMSPSTAVSDSSVGTRPWSNPQNVITSDSASATFSNIGNFPFDSHYLKASNFGFNIPGGATIDGIVVEIKRRTSFGAVDGKDKVVKLVKGGVISGNNKADTSSYWPTTFSYKSYGSNSDLWGVTFTPSDVNDSNFGMVLQAQDENDNENPLDVDHIRITVYYSESIAPPSTTSPTNDTTPTWTWTAFTDTGTGVSSYTVQWCQDSGFPIECDSNTATSGTTSFTHSSALSDGTWYLRVKAIDGAGNQSSYSSSGTVVIDSSAPTTPGTPTPAASPTADSTPTWTWTASTDSGVGLATNAYSVQWCQESDFPVGCNSNTATSTTNSFTHSTPLTEGLWYFKVKAIDAVGNESSYSSGQVFLDLSAPTGSITINGGNTGTNSTNVILSISATDNVSSSSGIQMKVSETGDLSGALYEPYVNSKAFTVSGGDGTKTVYIQFKDELGYESSIYSDSIILDTVVPTTPGTPSPDASPTTDNTPTWTWTASTDSGSGLAATPYTVQWCQNSEFPELTECDSNIDTSNTNSYTHGTALAEGTWYFRVKAIDAADNESSYSSNGSILIDTTGPTTPGTPSPASSPTTDNTPTWTWTASTDSGSGLATNAYSIEWCQDSSFTGCESNVDTSTTNSYTHSVALADGTWYFKAKAIDAVGNESDYSSNGQVIIDTIAPSIGGGLNSVTNNPLTLADDSSVGTFAWTGAIFASTSNNSYASFQNNGSFYPITDSHYLKATNFEFAIPSGATINGIKVEIERYTHALDPNGGIDKVVKLVKGGVVSGNNKADTSTFWPYGATDPNTYKSYGSSSDLWGLSLTADDVNASDFGVVLQAEDPNDNENQNRVDHIRITVYYTPVVSPSATSPTNDSTPTWSWEAYIDTGTGVSSYTVQWCQDSGFPIECDSNTATSGTTNFTHSTPLGDGTWYFRVKAIDGAGNQSSYSENGTVVIDTTDPITPGTPSPATSPTTDTTPTWTWTASTDSGVGLATNAYSVQWCHESSFTDLGCTSYTATSTTNSYTHSVGLSEGTWYFRVKAIDSLGNDSEYSNNGQITIDLSNPTGSITINGGNATTNSQNVLLSISANDNISGSSGIQMKVSENSNLSGASYEAYVNSKAFTLSAGDGTKTVYIQFKDEAGNESSIYSDSILLDTTDPTTPGTPATTNPSGDPTPTWTWTASTDSGSGLADPAYSVQWCEDSTFTGCEANTDSATTSSYTHSTALTDGIWYFRVKAADAVENESEYSSNGTVTIDTSVPTPSETATPTPTSTETITPTPDTTQTSSEVENLPAYSLTIRVLDVNNNPVAGAKVTLYSEVKEAFTDNHGFATFENVEPGQHRMVIAYQGYEGEQIVNLSGDMKDVKVDVVFKPTNATLQWEVIGLIAFLIALVGVLAALLVRKRGKQVGNVVN